MELVSAERMKPSPSDLAERTRELAREQRLDAILAFLDGEIEAIQNRRVAQAAQAELDYISTRVKQMAEEGRYGSLAKFWAAFQEPKTESRPIRGTSPSTDDISGPMIRFEVPTSSSQPVPSPLDALEHPFFDTQYDTASNYHPRLVFQLTTAEPARFEGYKFALDLAKKTGGSLSMLSFDDRLFRLDAALLTNAEFERLGSYSNAIIDCSEGTRVSYDEKRKLVYFDEGKTAGLRQHGRRLVGPFVGETDYLLQPKPGASLHELVEIAQHAGHVLRVYDATSGTLVFRDGVSEQPGFLIDNARKITPVQRTERYERAWTRMTNQQ